MIFGGVQSRDSGVGSAVQDTDRSIREPALHRLAAMASRNRRTVVLLVLLLACLLVASNFIRIGAETSENEEETGVEAVEDEEAETGESVVEGGENEDEESETGGADDEGGESEDEDEDEDEEEDEEERRVAFDDSDVIVLGSSNFTTFAARERYAMVEFYAPWCGHCQELAPEWAAAATALKGHGVAVAKVDATAHPSVAEALGVNSYPTLFLFVDGGPSLYAGDRTKDAIVNYVNKKMSLTIKALISKTDAEPLLEVESPIAVGYLDKLEGAEADELTSVARSEEGAEFYMTSDEDVAALFGLEKETKPALVLLKNVPDKRLVFKGDFKRNALYEFVSTNKSPLVISYTKQNTPLIFENTIKNQIICFVKDEEHWGYVRSVFERVSRTFRKQALFIRVRLGDSDAKQPSDYFGVTGEEDPITIMAFVTAEDGPKYMHEGELTFEGVKGFVEGFLANKLLPHYKSQPIPEQNIEDVKIAVSKNFEEMVLDESRDTLLELYAPDCHYCHDLEPIYKKLAKRLRSIPSLSIVKMDGLANEHPRAKPDGYPTLLFYPAGKKSFEPITFEGDRTVKGFYQFLKKNAAIPFALPRTAKSKPASKAVEEDVKDEL